ncbi:MAG: o-succinylbenzoate synthase [Eggerthellaceae bacterium]|nr:o-succinylbenzoate synthase [Eggerthellaceae bacterium]
MPVPSENNFAAVLESRAAEPQDFVCFLDTATDTRVTYFELRLRSVWLAREMEAQGVVRGGVCAVDMGNCPALLYTMCAAAYGGFSLVLLNKRLVEAEKKRRIAEVKRATRAEYLPILDEASANALVAEADAAGPNARGLLAQWARRGVASFDENANALYMLKAASVDRQKVVPLTWAHLMSAARACNTALATPNEGIWQLVLPAYHVDGIQTFFRSVLNHNAMLLYRSFDAARVLSDSLTFSATHIALGDKMLQDLLDLNENAAPTPSGKSPLETYECILVDATQPNKQTLIRALGQHVPVFMAYGHTETASYIAAGRLADSEHMTVELFDGYTTTITNPDSLGLGQIAVSGPSIISGYLNARAAFTADNFLLTNNRGRSEGSTLELAEASMSTFTSGGEDVYPAEIRDKILGFEGVTDAYVFGASDAVWGRRPIAFVEATEAVSRPGFNRFYAADDMRNRLSTRLSDFNMPDQFIFLDEFPRTSVGKVGTGTLERLWEARLQVARVEIWQLHIPLSNPIRTANARLRNRESTVVRITDFAGRTGVGECTSLAADAFGPETLAQDLPLLSDALAPLLVGRVLLHPGEATELFENAPGATEAPFARAALEMALWDLYGKVRSRSLRQLIGGRENVSETGSLREIPAGCAPGGVVVSLGTVPEMLSSVQEAVNAGYMRVKLKVKPGTDIDIVRAVRNEFPDLMIMLDANQSYRDDQLDILKQLDELGVECIEEPLDPAFVPTVGPTDLFDRLARLQTQLRMRVCLDESWQTDEQLQAALEKHPELRCVSLKIGKFGGIAAALDFYNWARERGIEAWPGGMYDTGISKRAHAAFALLPGVNLPGDISDSTRYFTVDISNPPFTLADGVLLVNEAAHPYGIGCELNETILANVTENYWVCE